MCGVAALTDEECVGGLIAVEQGHGVGVEPQPQSHRQHKGAHQLQEGMRKCKNLGATCKVPLPETRRTADVSPDAATQTEKPTVGRLTDRLLSAVAQHQVTHQTRNPPPPAFMVPGVR